MVARIVFGLVFISFSPKGYIYFCSIQTWLAYLKNLNGQTNPKQTKKKFMTENSRLLVRLTFWVQLKSKN